MDLVQNDLPAGDAFLHHSSLAIDPQDPHLEQLHARMLATVSLEQGVGIAAPQVGIVRRVILVKRLDLPDKPFVFYLNPQITQMSAEQELDREGCLSVPAGFGQVQRARSIVLRHQTADGQWQTEAIKDFTARIFQHEIGHLDGILFVERKEPEALVPKEENRRRRAAEKAAQEVSQDLGQEPGQNTGRDDNPCSPQPNDPPPATSQQ